MAMWQRDLASDDVGNYPITVLNWQTGRYINQYISTSEIEEPEPIADVQDAIGCRHAVREMNLDRLVYDPAQGQITRNVHRVLGRVPVVSGSLPRILMTEEKHFELGFTQSGHPFNTTAHRRSVLNVPDDLAGAITNAPP